VIKIKEGELAEACSIRKGGVKCTDYKILFRISQAKRSFGRSGRRWEDDIENAYKRI
jgi:hypothetical protein